jgi:hypothetical protein
MLKQQNSNPQEVRVSYLLQWFIGPCLQPFETTTSSKMVEMSTEEDVPPYNTTTANNQVWVHRLGLMVALMIPRSPVMVI